MMTKCEDCISRKEAILLFQRYGVGCFDADDFSVEQCTRFVISKLKELPSITPQSKTGRWIRCDILQEFKCSECRVCFRNKSNHCPNCGSKMIESECK